MEDDSVLNTIKKMLGLAPDYNAFDLDVQVAVNSALSSLSQITTGQYVTVTGPEVTWDDLNLGSNNVRELSKQYVYLRARLLFDPPSNSFIAASFEKQIEELSWRLEIMANRGV